MFRRILGWIAAVLIPAVVLVLAAYLRDMSRAYERVRGKSTVISSAYGDIEYTEGGAGPMRVNLRHPRPHAAGGSVAACAR